MDKFKNKYRINSIRFQDYDYTSEGAYFITICTKSSVNYFGRIVSEQMQLSNIGVIAENCWKQISKHFDNVILDEYKIMPNHVHGIIIISSDIISLQNDLSNKFSDEARDNRIDLQKTCRNNRNKFGKPIKKSLSVVINQYKSAVKRECNKRGMEFLWQERFFERVIRNKKEIRDIRKYIYNNMIKWEIENKSFKIKNIDFV